MKRNANATWDGRLKSGHGQITTESEVLKDASYSFSSRFEKGKGTNPEELLGAAHAACYSMALANELEAAHLSPTKIETQASVRIDLLEGKWTIQEVDLFLKANLEGAPSVPFLLAASRAKANCPISRVLLSKVNLHTELQDQHPDSETDADVVIYTSTYCQICGQAKTLLESKGIRYREIDLDVEPSEEADALKKKTGLTSVPQIFVGEHFIGSYQDLIQLDEDHGLDRLLKTKARGDISNGNEYGIRYKTEGSTKSSEHASR